MVSRTSLRRLRVAAASGVADAGAMWEVAAAMRNEAQWRPTKYILGANGLVAPRESPLRSRRAVEIVGAYVGRALNQHAAGRLLDLGCGSVPFYEAYCDRVSEITCVDWDASLHDTGHIDLAHDLARPLPFEAGRFDTVLLSDVLEHLPEPEPLLTDIARVLAPGGKLILNTPFLYWLHEMPHDFYRYTEFALRRFSERAGFEIVEITAIGGPLDVIADIASKAFERRRWGRPLALALQAVARRSTPPKNNRMPLGYGMIARKPF